jgi:hypothetical protein
MDEMNNRADFLDALPYIVDCFVVGRRYTLELDARGAQILLREAAKPMRHRFIRP